MKINKKYFFSLLILFLLVGNFTFCNFSSFAQDDKLPTITGSFSRDSLKVGKHIPFKVIFVHNYDQEVVFADSTYNFEPFEWIKTDAFPTQTNSKGIATDSAVYWLRSFELDTIQTLKLPVFVINQNSGDTLKYFTEVSTKETDFVLSKANLQNMLQKDSITFYQNTTFLEIPRFVNYPLYGLIMVVLLVGIILFFVFFGESIRRSYRLKRLQSQHERFIQEYASQLQQIENPEATDHTLGMWKAYIEKLKNEPFTTYTSKEISRLTKNESLGENLKVIDRAIYGGQIDNNTEQALQNLKNYAINIFEKRLAELRVTSENELNQESKRNRSSVVKARRKTNRNINKKINNKENV
ncbi:hypothetical protein WAF17_17545 [Bernardetia sp. ABR2-2B]|uniref:hypothetical protein n=1 Tax=Bernardetia sp. ABR2-2B TaxID=3127472 RepID=UPI0030CD3190